MVNHTRKRTAAAFRRLATFVLEKPSRNDPGTVRYIESEGGQDDLKSADHTTFQGVTDTRERYSEHEASEFRITLHEEDGEGDDVDPADAPTMRSGTRKLGRLSRRTGRGTMTTA